MSIVRTCLLVVLASACTTLGPMPATTGVSAVPAARPSAEVQAGVMPAFFLSSTAVKRTSEDEMGTQQLSGVFEPDRLLGVSGLIVGARSWGEDSPFEPMIGLRRKLDDSFSLAGIVYGTHVAGEDQGASYRASRLGGELSIDAALIPGRWVALHGQASIAATALSARGRYCVTDTGEGTDCDFDKYDRFADGELSGIYPSATTQLSLDIARRPTGYLHGIRIALLGSVGAMPRVRGGEQQADVDRYYSIGMSLTLGFGSAE
ncbi:MAG TPA: hypothetical protein VFQ53_23080 [Kofleriaceae bacterium]|nr:hypothetical protein [Kofleriaceae bacterium]